ncbi:MAG: DMT family transporter [Helicobacteraceae bacterium]|jgi:drug/metabolite transporter (DMT)-like permease|nr:DMT family transporter [Helicobacteraceae bacterium]
MQEERKGEIYMLLLSVIESWFPILSLFAIPLIGAMYSFALSIVIATIIFLALVLYQKKGHELFQKDARKDLLLTTFFINLLFILVFLGLQYTTAGNMAVIIFLQLLFAYLYFNVFGSDRLSPMHTLGAVIMGVGALTVLIPDDLSFNKGDLIILLAAAIAPFANLYQKRARSYVSSETILAFRNTMALPVLVVMAYFSEPLPTIENLVKATPYILAIGILVFGVSKVLWIEALHRISITKMSAMLALPPIFTLILAYYTLNETPDLRQILGVIPILIGGYLITKPEKSSNV